MAITQEEADRIEGMFLDAGLEEENMAALKAKKAWDELYALMERENNFTNELGIDSIDWQIGNWADDLTIDLHNTRRYEELLEVNENILNITWKHDNGLFHENAKREIADTYSYMGEQDKCFELYEKYLEEDPLWGWGWIGYFRQLNDHDDHRFEQVLDDLYAKVKSGNDFRDKEDLYRELGDEFNTLGKNDRADYFYKLEDNEKNKRRSPGLRDLVAALNSPKKVYPNDPCPCGSGKKYKKCCGRNA